MSDMSVGELWHFGISYVTISNTPDVAWQRMRTDADAIYLILSYANSGTAGHTSMILIAVAGCGGDLNARWTIGEGVTI